MLVFNIHMTLYTYKPLKNIHKTISFIHRGQWLWMYAIPDDPIYESKL